MTSLVILLSSIILISDNLADCFTPVSPLYDEWINFRTKAESLENPPLSLTNDIEALKDFLIKVGGLIPPNLDSLRPNELADWIQYGIELQGIEKSNLDGIVLEDYTISTEEFPFKIYRYHRGDADCSERDAIIYFHGGGFIQYYYARFFEFVATKILNHLDVQVFLVEYNVTVPDGDLSTKFPVASIQCFKAYRWIDRKKNLFNLSRLLLGGDSAGSNLVISTYLRIENHNQYNLEEKETPLSIPTHVLLISPFLSVWGERSLYTLGHNDAYGFDFNRVKFVWSNYARTERDYRDVYFNIFQKELEDEMTKFPQTLIFTGGHDPLKDDGKRFEELLRRLNIRVYHFEFRNTPHNAVLYDLVYPDITEIVIQSFASFANVRRLR